MTPDGRSYVLRRIEQATDLSALREVWESLGIEYARDPEIQKAKDDMKARLK